ncbi:MAG: hypothetical protein GEU97_21240 [Actinophytocola sp.]|nr:hypothetical protein [Actinophytocola sp.]
MNDRDRELLARLARVNGNMGAATLRLMRDLEDSVLLSADHLRELGTLLGELAKDLSARADELDGVGAPVVIDM